MQKSSQLHPYPHLRDPNSSHFQVSADLRRPCLAKGQGGHLESSMRAPRPSPAGGSQTTLSRASGAAPVPGVPRARSLPRRAPAGRHRPTQSSRSSSRAKESCSSPPGRPGHGCKAVAEPRAEPSVTLFTACSHPAGDLGWTGSRFCLSKRARGNYGASQKKAETV